MLHSKQYIQIMAVLAWKLPIMNIILDSFTSQLHISGRCAWQARGIYKLQWTRLLWASKKHIENKNGQDSMEGTRVFHLFMWRYHSNVCRQNTWMAAIFHLIQICTTRQWLWYFLCPTFIVLCHRLVSWNSEFT